MDTTANNNPLLWLTLIKCHVCTFCQLSIFENLIASRSLLKDWKYFQNKFVIPSYLPFPVSSFDIPDTKKRKLRCEWALEIKKIINYYLKGLYKTKTTCYKKKSNYSPFFFSHWRLFFLFPYQAVGKFWKINKILSINMEKIWKYR